MSQRLGDVLVAQHRFVFELLDRCERARAGRADIVLLADALKVHLESEERVTATAMQRLGVREEHDEGHAVIAFAAARLGMRAPVATAMARLRQLRDLLVRHVEPEERILIPALERVLGKRRSLAAAKRVMATFEECIAKDGRRARE